MGKGFRCWAESHQLWEVISARLGAKQVNACAGQGRMGTFVPQVPKDVLEKMAEHKKGEESNPGSPAVGQPPHGGDNKRYRLCGRWLWERDRVRVDRNGVPLCKGEPCSPDCPSLCWRRREAEAEWGMQQLETQVQDVCQMVNVVMSPKESRLLPAHPRGDSVGEGLTSLTPSCCSWACMLVHTPGLGTNPACLLLLGRLCPRTRKVWVWESPHVQW